MPQIHTLMILKNEAKTIGATLESVRATLGPEHAGFLIHDNGSTDDTVAICRSYGATVSEGREFRDFSYARNALLDDARKSVSAPLVLMLSASCVLAGNFYLDVDPDATGLTVDHYFGRTFFQRVDVFATKHAGKLYRYTGVTHEVIVPTGKEVPSGLELRFVLRDEERSAGRNWLRDLALLEGQSDPRSLFYYAQTLDCLGRESQAVRAYIKRAQCEGGFWQERVVSLIRCIPKAGKRREAEQFAKLALQLDGSRGEAYLNLCPYAVAEQNWPWLRQLANKAIECVPRTGALFQDLDREWRANEYAGDAYAATGDFKTARTYWARALACGGDRIPERIRETLRMGAEYTGP